MVKSLYLPLHLSYQHSHRVHVHTLRLDAIPLPAARRGHSGLRPFSATHGINEPTIVLIPSSSAPLIAPATTTQLPRSSVCAGRCTEKASCGVRGRGRRGEWQSRLDHATRREERQVQGILARARAESTLAWNHLSPTARGGNYWGVASWCGLTPRPRP